MNSPRGCLGWGFRTAAWILAGMFVLLMPPAITGRSMGAVLFSPARMEALVESRLIAPGILDKALLEALFRGRLDAENAGLFGRVAEFLSEAERQELMDSVLPGGWLGGQIVEGIQGFYGWIDGEEAHPALTLEIGPVKDRLLGGAIEAIVDTVVDSWPSCTPEEAERLRTELITTGETERLCEPPEPIRGQVVDWIALALQDETQRLPDRIPLVERMPDQAGALASLKQDLRTTRALMRWGWLIPVSLLGWIMAFAIRGQGEWARWWGMPLALAGLGTMALALIIQAGRSSLVVSLGADWTLADVAILRPVLLAAFGQVLGRTLFQGLLLTIVGGALWWYGRRKPASPTISGEVEGGLEEKAAPEKAEDADAGPMASPPPVAALDEDKEPPGPPPSGIFDKS